MTVITDLTSCIIFLWCYCSDVNKYHLTWLDLTWQPASTFDHLSRTSRQGQGWKKLVFFEAISSPEQGRLAWRLKDDQGLLSCGLSSLLDHILTLLVVTVGNYRRIKASVIFDSTSFLSDVGSGTVSVKKQLKHPASTRSTILQRFGVNRWTSLRTEGPPSPMAARWDNISPAYREQH